MAKQVFTTHGPVRGGCGHLHRSREGAARCQHADHVGCIDAGGHSDRSILKADQSGVFRDWNGQPYHPDGRSNPALTVDDIKETM